MARKLSEYRAKRDFSKTSEPEGEPRGTRSARKRASFVVQKHAASHLHYDFRLEIGGVMKSWAVPRGPSLDPAEKRLAVEVEDHPVEYNRFEGTIPEGEYGGGAVMIWDRGELVPTSRGRPTDLAAGYREGQIDFTLRGERLRGAYTLKRMAPARGSEKPKWILFKRTDEHARPGSDVTADETTSVVTGRSMEAIAHPEAAREDLVEQLSRVERDGGDGELTFEGGATLAVTSLGRVIAPEAGLTKGGLMRYYARVAPALLPLLKDRPLALRRFPRGVGGAGFYQHEPRNWPAPVRTARVRLEDGSVRPRLVGGDLVTLLYTVQLGAIEAHPWHARVASLSAPDYVVLDLDPGDGASYDRVVDVALRVRDALAASGLEGLPKTSGATGMHVVVPLAPKSTWRAAAALAERIARVVAYGAPGVATLERSLAKRPAGAVYVDHLQNARGKTVASAWSVRARPGATVSVPLDWSEVRPGLDPRAFTTEAALARVAARRGA